MGVKITNMAKVKKTEVVDEIVSTEGEVQVLFTKEKTINTATLLLNGYQFNVYDTDEHGAVYGGISVETSKWYSKKEFDELKNK